MFFPYLFVWYLLNKGFSTTSRVIGFGYLLVLVILISYGSNQATTQATAEQARVSMLSPVELREEQTTKLLSTACNGSHGYGSEYITADIKSHLRDPDSYQFIGCTTSRSKAGVTKIILFRSKNGFGGYVNNHVTYEYAYDSDTHSYK